MDVRRSSYCITTGVEARVLERGQITLPGRGIQSAHLSKEIFRMETRIQQPRSNRPVGEAERLESFKNFKNFVENVAFRGSPSPGSWNCLEPLFFDPALASITKVT